MTVQELKDWLAAVPSPTTTDVLIGDEEQVPFPHIEERWDWVPDVDLDGTRLSRRTRAQVVIL